MIFLTTVKICLQLVSVWTSSKFSELVDSLPHSPDFLRPCGKQAFEKIVEEGEKCW